MTASNAYENAQPVVTGALGNDNAARRQPLLRAYQAQGALEQSLVQLLAIIYSCVTKTAFVNCARKAGVRGADGKALSPHKLTPLLNKLVSRGLVEKPDHRFQCSPLIAELATRDALKQGHFEPMVKAVQETIKLYDYGWGSHYYFQDYDEVMRELRIAFYRGKTERVLSLLEVCSKRFPDQLFWHHPYLLICNNPFDAGWLRKLPDEMLGAVLNVILEHGVRAFEPVLDALPLAEKLVTEAGCTSLRYPLAEQWMARGELARAKDLIAGQEPDTRILTLQGWMAFVEGANGEAIEHYDTALRQLKKATRKRKICFDNLAGVFFVLALLRSGETSHLRLAADYIAIVEKNNYHRFITPYRHLRSVVQTQQGQLKDTETGKLNRSVIAALPRDIDGFFQAFSLHWRQAANDQSLLAPVQAVRAAAEKGGYQWFAAELAELLVRLGASEYRQAAQALHRRSGDGPSIVTLFEHKAPWEHVLNALVDLGHPQGATAAAGQRRLVWWLQYLHDGRCFMTPREQKLDARGHWSKGRAIALKRLHGGTGRPDFLTAQDIQVCAAVRKVHDNYYGGSSYELDYRKALPALVGHPLLFWEDAPEVRIELIRGEPELLVTQKRGHLRIEFYPHLPRDTTVMVAKETPTRLKVIEITRSHQEVLDLIGNGLKVPLAARDQVIEAISALSGTVTVQSSIGGGVENLEEVAADARPHVHLLPSGEGLTIALLVKPFTTGGPYYRPGAGGERVIAEVDGKRLQAKRDLELEQRLAAEIVAATPTLAHEQSKQEEWTLEDPEACLETLLELQSLGDKVVLEWPQGEKLKISQQASLGQFQLHIRRHKDWFSASGELSLDDGQVLDMQRLLDLVQQTPSRFVPLGEGRFLALTEAFRKRLDDLNSFAESTATGVRLHPLAVLALEDLTMEVGSLKTDRHWKAHVKKCREAGVIQPTLPSTLQAELRDYQQEGFRWLTRLAHWGVGACLADDMGLGKTVQALALILTRAQDGPTLVVAPTSVCMNWLEETRRFAPTLNVRLFGGGDRQRTLEEMGPFDLLVCSYSLLQLEVEKIAARPWQTIVLDEAQAIKNMATKRSQAAMALQGEFKMITTGTPIENHLGELWNLFRFLNPGLLGSLDKFKRRFAVPIERDHDAQARNRLKKLVQPFILRRIKSQVLEELPPRTEIVLHVEMSPEEMALYEALRRQALEKLSQATHPSGQRQLQILAEIMKLRRACCNPRLVMPDTTLASAKLAVFEEVLEELLENRHKALVFSQFVDHLSLIRELLDTRQVRYQYLDGSTPAPERKRRVDAFQAGQGEVFLISLKAGGVGLNLTAADYVVHMDPWWNPAVENQAADRAHRIGQQRPVTIYRLVVKDTIEEKIVALHQQKRDLADNLLEGGDASAKLSPEELLRLLQET